LTESLKERLDWGSLLPLRLQANQVADGVWAGSHKSPRKGAGIEFGGHRDYVAGDDLRWLDRHALMRHGKLMVRQFETETDRTLYLVLDASRSMAFRSKRAASAKLAYSALLAAALSRVALRGGDPVGIDWLARGQNRTLVASAGRDTFDRVITALEATSAEDSPNEAELGRLLARVARRAPRGAIVVFFSDLIDLPANAPEAFSALGARERSVVAVRVLDPVEADFPFDEPVLLRASEANTLVETDGALARQGYLSALEALTVRWQEQLLPQGGRVIRARTSDDPVQIVRDILRALTRRIL